MQRVQETIFTNGSDYFNALISDIEQSHYSIEIEAYIFSKDQVGARVAKSLITAATRGIEVRILIDGAGAPLWGGAMFSDMEKAGIKFKIFHPFPWELWNWSRSAVKLPILLKWFFLILKMNSRNHRKTVMVDHRIAYIGSINIDECHLTKSEGGEGWRDTAVRVVGIDLSDLSSAFEAAWTYRGLKERIRDTFRHVRKHSIIRLNYSRHRRRILYKHFLKRIQHAENRIWVTNAYFVPDNKLLKQFRRAAKRGIDVCILLPQKSDIIVMPWASSTFYLKLLKQGVKLFEYDNHVLHAKSLIIDNWMTIGSSNLNHRSILHDLEVDIVISTESAKEQLIKLFENDIKNSTEITLKNWRRRPWYQRWIGHILLYMKYWM